MGRRRAAEEFVLGAVLALCPAHGQTALRLEVLRTLHVDGGPIMAAAFALDGTTLATGGDVGDLRLLDVATRTVRWRAEPSDIWIGTVAFSPDGKTLACLDLEPFAALQKLCTLRTGGLLSFSEYARDAKVAPTTARRYLEYLRMSYQVLLLQPYARNLTSAVVKTPKVYWVDVGILRHGTKQWGDLTGAQFESVVVTEVYKWVSTAGRAVDLSFYRTRSGLEVDLLAESDGRVLGIEVKARDGADRADCLGLRALANALGDRWRGGLVVHDGTTIEDLDADAGPWGLPAHRLST